MIAHDALSLGVQVRHIHYRHIKELHDAGVTMLRVDAALYENVTETTSALNLFPWDYVYMEWWGEFPVGIHDEYIGHYRRVVKRCRESKVDTIGESIVGRTLVCRKLVLAQFPVHHPGDRSVNRCSPCPRLPQFLLWGRLDRSVRFLTGSLGQARRLHSGFIREARLNASVSVVVVSGVG